MGFLDDLYQEHGSSVQQRVSTELGIPPEKAARALPTVAPIILAGLKREMDKGGPAHIESHIQDLNHNGIPDDEEVGGLLGGKGKEASQLMASQLGISGDAAAKLIPMLAPVIIGMLMKKIEEGYDVVSGWRKNRQDKMISRKIPSKIANRLISKVTGVGIALVSS